MKIMISPQFWKVKSRGRTCLFLSTYRNSEDDFQACSDVSRRWCWHCGNPKFKLIKNTGLTFLGQWLTIHGTHHPWHPKQSMCFSSLEGEIHPIDEICTKSDWLFASHQETQVSSSLRRCSSGCWWQCHDQAINYV